MKLVSKRNIFLAFAAIILIVLICVKIQTYINISNINEANKYLSVKNYKDAFNLYYKMAKNNDPFALYSIGYMYYNGYGCDEDINKSLHYFHESWKQSGKKPIQICSVYACAMAILKCHDEDSYVNKVKLFLGGASIRNYSYSNYNLASLRYRKVIKDKADSKGVFFGILHELKDEIKNNGNEPDALYLLGKIYYDIRKDSSEYNEVYKLWRKSAEGGNNYAKYGIGLLYKNGDCGLPKDDLKANEWFNLSSITDEEYNKFIPDYKFTIPSPIDVLPYFKKGKHYDVGVGVHRVQQP